MKIQFRRWSAVVVLSAPLLFGLPLQGSAKAVKPASADAAGTKASGRCGVCHPDERVAFERSRHAGEEVHCISCHGGNDQVLDETTAHQGNNWRGKLSRAENPQMCASCHADERKMQPYDLPVDQYALYQMSGHGVALKKGDTRVAVCSDCHGSHEILGPRDPASSVYVTNIPRTCGTCHGDTTLVRERKMKNTYQAYLTSVHAHELFDKGNTKAPTCVSCHGVHGATPSEVGNVNKVCGRCHTAERRYFLAGPHAAGMAAKNMAECSSCHDDHAVKASVTDRLSAGCTDCHAKGSKDAKLGDVLLEEYKGALDEVQKADAMVAKADAVPLQTEDYRARIEEARTYLREALTAAHSVQPEVMAGFTARARAVGEEVSDELKGKLQNIMVEKLVLVVFWFYVIVTIGILRRLRGGSPQAVK